VAFLGSVVTKNNKHEKGPGVLLRFIAFILTTMLVVVCATGFALLHHEDNASTRVRFNLVDHNNIETTEKDFRGNWLLIYFGFTNCAKVCPMQMTVMTKILQGLDKSGHSNLVTPILITVDPKRDSPEVMKKYVAHFDDRIVGLTGTKQEINTVLKTFNTFSVMAKKSNRLSYDVIHPDFFYLVGPDGELKQHYANDQNSIQLTSNIRNKLQGDREIL